MLFYDVVSNFRKCKDKMSRELSWELTTLPHYFAAAKTLGLLSMDEINKDRRISLKDICLPHDEMLLTIKEDHIDGINEAFIHLKDCTTLIKLIAYIDIDTKKFIINEPIMIEAEIHDGGSRGEVGFKFLKTNIAGMFTKLKESDMEKEFGQYIWDILTRFNTVINKSKDVREGVEQRSFKSCKKTKGKKAYSNVTIIHLGSHKYLSKHGYSTGKSIEWSNSWVVRGHWRYSSDKMKLGKDRHGVRGEMGRTWVVPYQKQTHLKLDNKIREVRE